MSHWNFRWHLKSNLTLPLEQCGVEALLTPLVANTLVLPLLNQMGEALSHETLCCVATCKRFLRPPFLCLSRLIAC